MRAAILLPFSKMNRQQKSIGRKALEFTLIVVLLPVILPLAIVGLVLHALNKIVVYLLVWVWWLPNGKDVLFIRHARSCSLLLSAHKFI